MRWRAYWRIDHAPADRRNGLSTPSAIGGGSNLRLTTTAWLYSPDILACEVGSTRHSRRSVRSAFWSARGQEADIAVPCYRPSFSGVRQSYLFATPAGSIAAIQQPAPHDRGSAREHPPAGSLFGRRSFRRHFVLTERARHPGRPGGTEPFVEIGGWGSREMPMEISSLVEVSKHPAGYPCVTRSRWCRHRCAPDYLTYNTFRGKREGGRGSV